MNGVKHPETSNRNTSLAKHPWSDCNLSPVSPQPFTNHKLVASWQSTGAIAAAAIEQSTIQVRGWKEKCMSREWVLVRKLDSPRWVDQASEAHSWRSLLSACRHAIFWGDHISSLGIHNICFEVVFMFNLWPKLRWRKLRNPVLFVPDFMRNH